MFDIKITGTYSHVILVLLCTVYMYNTVQYVYIFSVVFFCAYCLLHACDQRYSTLHAHAATHDTQDKRSVIPTVHNTHTWEM